MSSTPRDSNEVRGASYQARPRIVRIFRRGSRLLLFFSCPLADRKVGAAELPFSSGGQPINVTKVSVAKGKWPQVLIVELGQPLVNTTAISVALGRALHGANGELATSWASDERVVEVPPNATLVGEFAQLMNQSLQD